MTNSGPVVLPPPMKGEVVVASPCTEGMAAMASDSDMEQAGKSGSSHHYKEQSCYHKRLLDYKIKVN